jgi:hypothetical protein
MCVWLFVAAMMIITRIPWAGHVARVGRGEVRTRFWWGNLREGEHLKDPGVDGRIILKWIFEKWDVGTRPNWARIWIGGWLL